VSAVSVIATVKDEERTVNAFLESLLAQSRPPDEIVVVDGGSTDGTVAAIQKLGQSNPTLRVLEAPGSNIAAGRNAAIEEAAGPVVAVTDGGTVADPTWLEELVAPLERDERVGVSSGFFEPEGDTWFERSLSAVVVPHVREVDPARFLPSSRSVAFRKEWWRRVGGYPEWLNHCEDLVFDLDLLRAGARSAFVPQAIVRWNVRSSLLAFFRQYFFYARGDGHANLWPKRHAARYSAYVLGSALLLEGRRRPMAYVVLAAGFASYVQKFYRRAWRHRARGGLRALAGPALLLPVIVITGDIAKMIGYPVGSYERVRMDIAAERGVQSR
jgi:glycosyltransferase involved in cell wall biosynthesis